MKKKRAGKAIKRVKVTFSTPETILKGVDAIAARSMSTRSHALNQLLRHAIGLDAARDAT